MKTERKVYFAIMTMIVFICFLYISYLTPLAGDDWGYAINGIKGNPFLMALQFYQTWSGRFFSELYGFIVTPNKFLWNILNPLLFVIIFIMLNLIANPKSKLLLFVVAFFGMAFVSDNLRMETYTWLMGTTYVIPLALVLIYLYSVFKNINKSKMSNSYLVIGIITNIYISLAMENIAAVLILINICLFVYRIVEGEYSLRVLAVLLISVVGFLFLRFSPGASYRLSLNTAYLDSSFFEKIGNNLEYFLKFTFFDNKYLILLLNLAILLYLATKETFGHVIIAGLVLGLSSIMLLSNKLYSITNLEFIKSFSQNQILALIIFTCFIIYLFFFINAIFESDNRLKLNFFLIIAGASNLVMLYSPIFGSRSSIYFYYFTIIIVMMILDAIKEDITSKFIIVLIMGLSLFKVIQIKGKYDLMNDYYQIKLAEINYYQDHLEESDIWLIRMPIYTVHAQDIEDDDTYHQDVFKEYFNLNPDGKLHFYYKEN